MIRVRFCAIPFLAALLGACPALSGQEVFRVRKTLPEPGPQITPYLRYLTAIAWEQDERRQAEFRAVRSEEDLARLRQELRAKLLRAIGGLPMVEDAEIVTRFARAKLGLEEVVVLGGAASDGLPADAIAECIPGVRLDTRSPSGKPGWAGIVDQKLELWPIANLLPGGAYVR